MPQSVRNIERDNAILQIAKRCYYTGELLPTHYEIGLEVNTSVSMIGNILERMRDLGWIETQPSKKHTGSGRRLRVISVINSLERTD